MSEKPELLYDNEFIEKVLIEIDGFYAFRNAFRGDEKTYADNMLGVLTKIRALIPNEVLETIPDHYALSNKALGELEEKCRNALREKILD